LMAWFSPGEVPIMPKRFFIACISDEFIQMAIGYQHLAVSFCRSICWVDYVPSQIG
jgi:hypothetical protein